jgi:hypothetical protein
MFTKVILAAKRKAQTANGTVGAIRAAVNDTYTALRQGHQDIVKDYRLAR